MKVTINAVFEGSKEELISVMQGSQINIPIKEIVLPELRQPLVVDRNGDIIEKGNTVTIDPGEFGETNNQKLKLDQRIVGETGEIIGFIHNIGKYGYIVEVKLKNNKFSKANIQCYSEWLVLVKKK